MRSLPSGMLHSLRHERSESRWVIKRSLLQHRPGLFSWPTWHHALEQNAPIITWGQHGVYNDSFQLPCRYCVVFLNLVEWEALPSNDLFNFSGPTIWAPAAWDALKVRIYLHSALTKQVGQHLMLSVPCVDHAIVDFFSDFQTSYYYCASTWTLHGPSE